MQYSMEVDNMFELGPRKDVKLPWVKLRRMLYLELMRKLSEQTKVELATCASIAQGCSTMTFGHDPE